MRVCVDTNVLVRAASRPGSPAEEVVRRILFADEHALVVSSHILTELERVLRYPRVIRRTKATEAQLETFCALLTGIAEVVELSNHADAVATDPDDDIVVQTAVVAKADVICTRDRHIRNPEVISYCSKLSIRILDDLELLLLLRVD